VAKVIGLSFSTETDHGMIPDLLRISASADVRQPLLEVLPRSGEVGQADSVRLSQPPSDLHGLLRHRQRLLPPTGLGQPLAEVLQRCGPVGQVNPDADR
jgi:hypothetical protein